ncbi:MAG TPA: LuxR C-terminal-related transcriptional regulator [Gaiellaceae bacterium]
MAAEAVATRRRIIPRPRLTKLLDESPARIKLLVAPAGYGKTTLAQQWLSTPPRQGLWYRGGPASADVAALAAGVSNLIGDLIPDAGGRMRKRIRSVGQPEDHVDLLAALFAEDIQQWPSDVWLAIDDYQFAMESTASERFLELLVQDTPIRLIVTSRRRPTWATARRIVYGELQEIDRRELAMAAEEAKSVIGRDDQDVIALLAHARGWPAVIGLAATTDHLRAPEHGLPPALYDYFAEELYQQVAPPLRLALCKLCLTRVITPDMARFLFGESYAPALEVGCRLGILQTQGATYEMHPLIRTFLEAKLVSLEEANSFELAGQVVDHLTRTGAWDDAFDVIDRFSVHDRLEALVSAAVEDIIETGRVTTLAQWLEFAAKHHLTAPILDFAEAELAFRHGRYGTAAALASNAARIADGAPEYGQRLRALILLRAGQSALLDSRETEALRHFREARKIAPTGSLEREAAIGQFFSCVDLGLDEVAELLDDLEAISTRGSEDLVRLSIARMLYAERTGGLADALNSAADVYPLLDRVTDPVITTSFLNSYGQSLGLMAWYETAIRLADEAETVAREYRLDFVLSHVAILRGMAAIGLRDVSAAEDAIAHAEQGPEDPHITAGAATLRARLALLRGHPDQAFATLSTPLGRLPSDAMYAEYLSSRALAAAATGDFGTATELSNQVLLAPRFARGGATTATLVKAVSVLESNPGAREAVAESLAFVLDGGRFDEFVAAYRTFPVLLSAAFASASFRDVARSIVARANDVKLARRIGVEVTAPLIGPLGRLTPREREVLGLVAKGLTNKQIAAHLVISQATVKVHVRHALEKLGATTRAEAAVMLSAVPP